MEATNTDHLKGGMMNAVILNDLAQQMLQQRIERSEQVRMARQIGSAHRAKRRLARAMASGLSSGLTLETAICEWTRISRGHRLARAE